MSNEIPTQGEQFYYILYKKTRTQLLRINKRFPNSRIISALSYFVEDVVFSTLRFNNRTKTWFGLSHAKENIYLIFPPKYADMALEISSVLEAEGYQTFSSYRNWNTGAFQPPEIYFQRNSADCSIFLAILSKAFYKSLYCPVELDAAKKRAQEGKAKIIYLLAEQIDPRQSDIEAECVSIVGLSLDACRQAILLAIKSEDKLISPIENISAPFTFGWNDANKIGLIAGPENTPNFPFSQSEADHEQRLGALRESATRLVAGLSGPSHNVRSAYRISLEHYLSDLPLKPGSGNFLLADCEARTLRGMFEEDAAILSRDFAERLNRILELHTALRPYYDGVERFYDDVRRGTLSQPLPVDAINNFANEVRKHTPEFFEPDVPSTFEAITEQRLPQQQPIRPTKDLDPESSAPITPRPDPIESPDPEKMQNYGQASTVNAIYKVFLKGKDISSAVKGWGDAANSLSEHAAPVIDWLKDFLPPH